MATPRAGDTYVIAADGTGEAARPPVFDASASPAAARTPSGARHRSDGSAPGHGDTDGDADRGGRPAAGGGPEVGQATVAVTADELFGTDRPDPDRTIAAYQEPADRAAPEGTERTGNAGNRSADDLTDGRTAVIAGGGTGDHDFVRPAGDPATGGAPVGPYGLPPGGPGPVDGPGAVDAGNTATPGARHAADIGGSSPSRAEPPAGDFDAGRTRTLGPDAVSDAVSGAWGEPSMPPGSGGHVAPSVPVSPPAGFPTPPSPATGGHEYDGAGRAHGHTESATPAEPAADLGSGGFERTMLVHPPDPAESGPVPRPATDPEAGRGGAPGGQDDFSTSTFGPSTGDFESSVTADLGRRGATETSSSPGTWSDQFDQGRHADPAADDRDATVTQDLATRRHRAQRQTATDADPYQGAHHPGAGRPAAPRQEFDAAASDPWGTGGQGYAAAEPGGRGHDPRQGTGGFGYDAPAADGRPQESSGPGGDATTENMRMPQRSHDLPSGGHPRHPHGTPEQGYPQQAQHVDQGYAQPTRQGHATPAGSTDSHASPYAPDGQRMPQGYGHQEMPGGHGPGGQGHGGQSGGYGRPAPGGSFTEPQASHDQAAHQAQHPGRGQLGGHRGTSGAHGPHGPQGAQGGHPGQFPQMAPGQYGQPGQPGRPGQGYGQPAGSGHGDPAFGPRQGDGYKGYPGYRNADEGYGEEKSSTGKVMLAVGGGLAILAVVLVVFFFVLA